MTGRERKCKNLKLALLRLAWGNNPGPGKRLAGPRSARVGTAILELRCLRKWDTQALTARDLDRTRAE
jgi:hypothetical protein